MYLYILNLVTQSCFSSFLFHDFAICSTSHHTCQHQVIAMNNILKTCFKGHLFPSCEQRMICFLLASDSHLLASQVPPHLFQTGICMAFRCYEIICSTSYMPEETAMASVSFHLLAFLFFLFYKIVQEVNSCCRKRSKSLRHPRF